MKNESVTKMAEEIKSRGWKGVGQFCRYIDVSERTLRNWKQDYPFRYKAILTIPVPDNL